MEFIKLDKELVLSHLKKLKEDQTPLWGKMSPQRMIEHLTDAISLAYSDHSFKLAVPEDKVEKVQHFLKSEHPLPKNFEVEFAKESTRTRNNSMSEAIDEFFDTWNQFDAFFAENPEKRTLHPSFGKLNYELWNQLHSKHLTHHLAQFGLYE